MPAQREPRLQQSRHGPGPDLGQPAPLGSANGASGQSRVGLAAPQVEGRARAAALRLLRVATGQTGAAAGREVADAERVDVRDPA